MPARWHARLDAPLVGRGRELAAASARVGAGAVGARLRVVHAARRRRRGQVAPDRGVPRRSRRDRRSRPLSALWRRDHLLAGAEIVIQLGNRGRRARRTARGPRRRRDTDLVGGDRAGFSRGCSRTRPGSSHYSSSSTTSTGASPRSSISSSTRRPGRGAPILVLCLGRPELLDRRPAGAAGC